MRSACGSSGDDSADVLGFERDIRVRLGSVHDEQSLAGRRSCTFHCCERRCHLRSFFTVFRASLAPHIKHASRAETLAVSATLTEEAYGISLEQLTSDPDWTCKYALALNIVLIATWAISVWAGSIIGSAVDIPTSLAGFVCTSLFTYLLFCQSASRGNVLAALVANDLVQPAALCKAAAVLLTSPAAAFGVIWPVAMPFIACAIVVAVTVKTLSMLGACVTGAVAYLLLSLA